MEQCPSHEQMERAVFNLTKELNRLNEARAAEVERMATTTNTMATLANQMQSISECLVEIKISLPTNYITKTDFTNFTSNCEKKLVDTDKRLDKVEKHLSHADGKNIGIEGLESKLLRWGGWVIAFVSLVITYTKFVQ